MSNSQFVKLVLGLENDPLLQKVMQKLVEKNESVKK